MQQWSRIATLSVLPSEQPGESFVQEINDEGEAESRVLDFVAARELMYLSGVDENIVALPELTRSTMILMPSIELPFRSAPLSKQFG